MNTITLGDYSIEYTIKEEAYTWFLDNIYNPIDKDRGISPGESLKSYMKKEIEEMLN